MRTSMIRHGSPATGALLIPMAILTALLGGCVVYEPVPAPASYRSTYDRAWNSTLGAAEDAGVKISSADRTTGIIRGAAGSKGVTISVTTQADGRTRVEFASKGPKDRDADLDQRLTRAWT